MNITIIGGGIAGLSTALALHKLGFNCEVYERASELVKVETNTCNVLVNIK